MFKANPSPTEKKNKYTYIEWLFVAKQCFIDVTSVWQSLYVYFLLHTKATVIFVRVCVLDLTLNLHLGLMLVEKYFIVHFLLGNSIFRKLNGYDV